ncbi:hypothetical protein EJ04DRAFT_512249 [Polyplosphaeria fusca]|uniref:Uncharacterized protein n=1 Tax=Polyplosphaeria fusca TaxID=682080 RepID=A0A9P4QW69_9PLEO|nr:hypothetical protein EJ04DRAFT_512249 [Polyplosphaeria fusca]
MLFKKLPLLLLVSFGAASPWHLREAEVSALFARQDETDPPSCSTSCDIDTCGGGTCSVAGLSLNSRSVDDLGVLLESLAFINVTRAYGNGKELHVDSRELSKRIWRFDPASNTPVGDTEPTTAEVDTYVPAVFNGREDTYFGSPLFLSAGDERAYSQQVEFGNRPFQIMTGGIHGCMTVMLVSNRAVWAAHFWESYSHGKPNLDTPATEPAFVDRVLKFIKGEEVKNAAPSTYKPYITPTGPAPNPDWFNGDNDETQLFISTPIADGQKLENPNAKLKYPTRVTAMESEFRRRIGKKPKAVRIPYMRLDYSKPAEKALENRSNRGMHLFQYDPDSDGKGKRSWRIFMEARYTVKNLS